jgi:signal recognition particle subunit SRP54
VGKSIDVPVFEQGAGDPVAICQSAIEEAKASKTDVVILDTAGRLHVDGEMMTEIQEIAEAAQPVEILFIVDGMTGQDAVNSAEAFSAALTLTGTILTKLDGDARGGAAVSITEVTGVPIKFIGVSEKPDGLEPFDPNRIADRILGFGDVISLVEKAKDVVDQTEAKKLEKKLKDATFDLEDFRSQLDQLKKMGPLNQIVGMMPGVNRKMMKGLDLDDRQLSWTDAIISSMTPAERKNPSIIDGSRRSRISKGSGRPVQEINQLLKQFAEMKKMMKKMGKMKLPKNLQEQMMGLN